MDESCRARFSILSAIVLAASIGANAAEPIRWFNGTWDERGAPQGKTEVLDARLKEFADSFDRPGMETERPYKCDFPKLRNMALDAFGRVAIGR